MVIESQQKSYQDLQKEYDFLYATQPVRDEDRAYAWFAKRLVEHKSNLRSMLDIACGGGYFLREVKKLLPAGASLAGIDLSEKALEIARKECPQAELSLGVAENLPYPAASFDAITCLGSLEHFMDIPKAVEEMKRVSRKDGIFFILVPNIFWYKDIASVLFTGNRKVRNQTHERFASLGEWRELLEDQGLRVLFAEKYNGIARSAFKQWLKDILIPLRFSYHFLFICDKGGVSF